jgi:HlyD family secretion protein
MTPPTQPPSATAARERRRSQQRRRRRRWAATLATVAIVGAAGGAWWWLTQRPEGAEAASGPSYLEVTPRTYQVTVPAPGTLQAATTAEMRTVTSGSVSWTAALGDRVAIGDAVARLDPTDLERDLRDAELALERSERALTAARADRVDVERSLTNAVDDAERRLQRALDEAAEATAKLDLTTRLADVGSASPRELADAQSARANALDDVASAERALAAARDDLDTRIAKAERDLADAIAAIEQAQVKLERAAAALAGATLIAPFDGVVSEVRIAAGGFAGSNATLLTIADDRRLELVAQVDETEISQIEVGQSARVTVMALANRSVQASVVAVAPGARTSQNIPVFEVVLGIDNADGALRPGMTGEAEVVVRQEADTVTLPAAAVTRNPRGDGVVAVLLDDGETERRQVEVVATVGASLVVRGDLPAGTQVEVPAANAVATAPSATPGILPSTQLTRELVPGAVPAPGTLPGSGGGRGAGGGGGQ